ncbi:MAG: arylsulfatase [Planctomycetaceae bacterium]|nr:arylsulfatase [Planctomycetaceae bacterium]
MHVIARVVFGFAGLVACLGLAPKGYANERPNIVVILCDDMGFSDIGCYGGEINTPNLDRLAANGLRFIDFHNNAKCSETRASLLTGLWHQQSRNLKKPGHVTLAEVLKTAGYRTLMSGKWHLAKTPPERGFDRYFGFLGGAINFYTGRDWGNGKNLMRLDGDVYNPPEDFYSTDAFTDYAVKFIDEAMETDTPFFLYLAHNAPHFPLHALPEDIAKYRGKYSEGWDIIRERRYKRLKELGVIDNTWRLSKRDPKVEGWNDLTDAEKKFLEPMMEVYAAMVDRLDQNIGRLVKHLEDKKQLDNTLILFLSDNGACPYQRLRNDVLTPGPANSDIAYDARWANMCNTPLRLYKQYAHEGGTSTPMIAHWPKGISARGELTSFTSHLVDIMPTLVEIAGAEYPKEQDGQTIDSMEGISLVPAFRGEQTRGKHPLYWDFNANHAIRAGDWKLVAERGKSWELYNLADDRSETHNLTMEQPELVMKLGRQYDTWAKRTGATPHQAAQKKKPSQQSQLFNLDAIFSKAKKR